MPYQHCGNSYKDVCVEGRHDGYFPFGSKNLANKAKSKKVEE